MSKRWSNHFVAHINAGGTILPGVQRTLPSGAQAERTLTFANAGISLGWLVTRRLNLMLEYLTNFLSEIDGVGGVNRFQKLTLNPLIRGSIDIGKLQIVPGIGVPLTWSQGDFQPGIFFYLSLEHPFRETDDQSCPRSKSLETR